MKIQEIKNLVEKLKLQMLTSPWSRLESPSANFMVVSGNILLSLLISLIAIIKACILCTPESDFE